MRTYTVHEPPNPPADRIDRAEKLEFVRDGFYWRAFLFTPIWLVFHRLWLPFLAFLAGVLAIALAVNGLKAGPQWGTFLALAGQAVVGYEAGLLRRWRLDRRGWTMVGTVTGRNRAECERRFLTAWLDQQPVIALPKSATAATPRRARGFSLWQAPFDRRT